MKFGKSAAACAERLFDALTLKPCNLELARALHSAGHASHDVGRGLGEDDLMAQLADLHRDGGDLRIEPMGHGAENFVVSLRQHCHRILELASIDIYRIASGKVAEHWRVIQPSAAVVAKVTAPVRASTTRPLSKRANQKHPGQPEMRRV